LRPTVITNLVSWTSVFFASLLVMMAAVRARDRLAPRVDEPVLPGPVTASPPHTSPLDLAFGRTFATSGVEKVSETGTSTPIISQRPSLDCVPLPRRNSPVPWSKFAAQYPIFLSFFCLLAIGAPVIAATGDSRFLDGCTLWLVWITSIRLQRLFKQSELCLDSPRLKNACATIMNPVLMTTLVMMAYTRAKIAAISGYNLARVLSDFSGGSPLYAIWTSSVTHTELPGNPDLYFGAGDAALSILEVGILIWGFKLYECRRQLCSIAGLSTIILSVAAAAGNVFLCVPCGHLIGLEGPEALAFAARSTTLALAKPAIETVGGNMVVNAALVVSNGILGQLLYPLAPGLLGVKREEEVSSATSSTKSSQGTGSSSQRALLGSDNGHGHKRAVGDNSDDPMIIAAGITIGINGAAMGVAYLYENRSRAAPYAALAMTVFGVMTVVFTTVEPFKMAVISQAHL
jgi:putative effector of murein hydrolase